MTTELTAKQSDVLAFMRGFFAENDHLPGGPDIARHFGFRSPNAGAEYISALERKGYVERNAVGRYRFTRSTECANAPAASTTL